MFSIPSPCSRRAIFTFDGNIVETLFYVATLCKRKSIRLRAIDLQQKQARRESIWIDTIVAKIATWLLKGEGDGRHSDELPESARLRFVIFSLVGKKGVYHVFAEDIERGKDAAGLLTW